MERGSGGIRVAGAWVITLFGLTALGVLPLYLFRVNVQNLNPQTVSLPVGIGLELTAYAPSLAALLVVAFIPGAGGVRSLLGQLRRWRVNPGWYGLAILGPVLFFLVADLIRVVLGEAVPNPLIALPTGFALVFRIGSVIAGSFGEEIGWRGFGQPRIQSRYGALMASLVIGVIWTIWHYWGLAAPGGFADFSVGGVGLSLARMIALSVLYAWMYNSTHGSLPLAMAAHAGHNIANNIVRSPSAGVQIGDLVIALYAVAAIAVVMLTGLRRWGVRFQGLPPGAGT